MPVVSDYVIGLGLFACFLLYHLTGLVLSDSDTLSPSAPIANKASAYAPPALTTHMRRTHKDSSPARAAMPSHMPRAYARWVCRVATPRCDDQRDHRDELTAG